MSERELLYAILRQLRLIQQDAKAVRKEDREKREHPQYQVDIRSELRLPAAINNYYVSEQSDRKGKNRREKAHVILELFALAAAGFAAFYAYRTFGQINEQAKAADRQVSIMQRQLEASERSWIKLVSCKPLELYFWNGAAGVNTQVTIQNVGHSVATHVHVGVEIVLPIWRNDWATILPKAQKDICSTVSKSQGDATVFVNDSLIRNPGSSARIGPAQVNTMEGRRQIMPLFAGCVDYQDSVSGERHHQTSFVYDVLNPPVNGGSSRFFEIPREFGPEPIRITALRLDHEEQYDFAN